MANSIDLIVSKEAQKQLDDLYKSLTKTHEEVVAISKLQLSFNGGQSPKSVTDLNDKIKDQAKIQAQLEKQIEKNRLAEIRLQQVREKAFDKYNAQLQKEEARLKASESVYNKIQNSMNLLQKTYKDLAIRKELGSQLTEKEEKSLERLGKRIQDYDRALKAVDGQMGKYQRNVGNYAGAFNPLSNSINQLSREMPAFANSVQTGFMAISNNLPIFFDSIGNIIKQNKELQAQGQPTQSVFKQLAGALFSWGTALSVGVTLLTIYGKDIVEFASNLLKGSKSIDVMKESQKSLNEISIQARKNSIEEITNMKLLLGVAKDTSLSYKEREIALNKLQETYPAYFGNLSKEKILAGQTAEAELELTNAILSRAKANAAVTKITENQSKIIDLELKALEKQKEIIKLRADVKRSEAVQSQTIGGGTVTGTYDLSITSVNRLASATRSLNNINAEKDSLTKINNTLTTFALENQKKSIKLEQEETKETKKNTTEKKEKLKVDKEINRGTEEYFNSEISRLEKLRASVATTTKEYESYNAQLEFLNASLMYLRGGERLQMAGLVTGATTELEQLPIATKESLEKTSQYLQSFYDQFGSESGMPTLFKVLNNEIEGFGFKATDNWKTTAVAMMEIGQELTNTLMNQSKARFDAEYARLEQQKNVSLAFAGSSATARAEIERQYEEKRKVIQRRQAEAEKRMAMFNIAVNTAQAIVATLGKTGFAGIPLSLVVGAIGAAQLAMVAAQEIPAFAEGGVHEGGKMLINDAKGSKYQETVVTPDGKIRQFKGRNKVVDAPKGTQIFTPDQWSKQINNLLLKNNISPLQTNQTNGINKDDLESVFRKYSGSNEVAIDINENGFKKMISSNGRTREILNSRLTTKGRIV